MIKLDFEAKSPKFNRILKLTIPRKNHKRIKSYKEFLSKGSVCILVLLNK